jgi:hypothetical protein
MWPVVKDVCDNACWLVILVRCRATGRILAYCRDCGAIWATPLELRENKYAVGSELCPRGIEIPSPTEIDRSIWEGCVREFVPESNYSTESEINVDLARQRSTRSDPAREIGLFGELPVSCRSRWLEIAARVAYWFEQRLGSVWYRRSSSMADRLSRAREKCNG